MPEDRKITLALAQRALSHRTGELPRDIVLRARQCIVDWFAVTLAALDDPTHTRLAAALIQDEHTGRASIIGRAGHYPASQAALINGATAHALDFDDVNLAISGHPSAVVFSALLALAELEGSRGDAVLSAFVAGYETACRVGRLVCPDHLTRGFHATGTVGSFGAAAACAHLLNFDAPQTAAAMGLAGTQASGLKAMFGTMGKPLHAGLAARAGLESALLVRNGFGSRPDILECPNGFAATHSADFNAQAALCDEPGGFHLRNNLFKYDASCYGTHAAIECIRQIKQRHGIRPSAVDSVHIRADRSIDTICNIENPNTGLQGKFSIRLNAAFSLLGVDTGKIESYDDELVNDPRVTAIVDRIKVELVDGWPSMQAEVAIQTRDGQRHSHLHDAGLASPDIDDQEARINQKFQNLAIPVLGPEGAGELLAALHAIEDAANVRDLARYCVPQKCVA